MNPFALDWKSIFQPGVPAVEIFLRGTIVYWALFLMMRFVLKREGGNIGLADLLVTVLVADAAQNAMGADYKSITDGMILVGTLVFWNYTLDWAGYRFPAVRRFTDPDPVKLITEGRMLRRNMRQALISESELLSQIRENGIEELAQVKSAYMEGDGRISVIKQEP